MDKVASTDGTLIAFHRRGSGPPLILIPGSGAANPVAWTAVIPTLEEHFSVYAVDRRGHGESGDGPVYAIDKVLPNSRMAVMSGQQHIAMYTAPEIFLNNVLAFLNESN